MHTTEIPAAAPVLYEEPHETLHRLVALVNRTAERQINISTPSLYIEVGAVGMQETVARPAVTRRPPDPVLDHQPHTRRFWNDEDTMERVLVGLRRLDEPKQEAAPPDPGLDDNPLVTRRFSDDTDTLERVLVGLRGLPGNSARQPDATIPHPAEVKPGPRQISYTLSRPPVVPGPDGAQKPQAPNLSEYIPRDRLYELMHMVRQIQARHARHLGDLTPDRTDRRMAYDERPSPSAHATIRTEGPANSTDPTERTGTVAEIEKAEDKPEAIAARAQIDKRLAAAGFDLTGGRLEMSGRLRLQAARNPKGGYRGLRRDYNTLGGRLSMLSRRLGSFAMRRMALLGAGSDSVIAGVNAALNHLP